jgi:methylmalonyl-CoA mutase N-terminal domain/subunit
VNRFQRPPREGEINVLAIPPGTEADQIKALQARQDTREPKAVENSLLELEAAATTPANLIPLLVECARAECTLGEMVNALKRVFGVYRESPAL